jgi:hypothetical protein
VKWIDNAKQEFHRLWTIRASIAFAVFTAAAVALDAHAAVFNPWVLLVLSIVFNGLLIPITRLAKQAEPVAPPEPKE